MPPATLFVVFIFEVSEMSMGITTKKVLLAQVWHLRLLVLA